MNYLTILAILELQLNELQNRATTTVQIVQVNPVGLEGENATTSQFSGGATYLDEKYTHIAPITEIVWPKVPSVNQ